MAQFDFAAALRWARFDPGTTLARRPDDELSFVGDAATAGPELLLDTCVYIDGLQARAPSVVADLLKIRHANHSTVAIQELMHTVGVLDPKHPGTRMAVKQIGAVLEGMPSHRVFEPGAETAGRAAFLSGMLCRLQGYQKGNKHRALQDCILFLQAQKAGFTVLTANVADFDYLLQLVPAGRVLFYRC